MPRLTFTGALFALGLALALSVHGFAADETVVVSKETGLEKLDPQEAVAALKAARWEVLPAGVVYRKKSETETKLRRTTTALFEMRTAEGQQLRRTESNSVALSGARKGSATRTLRITDAAGTWEIFPLTKVAVLTPMPIDLEKLKAQMKALMEAEAAGSSAQREESRIVAGQRVIIEGRPVLKVVQTITPKGQERMKPAATLALAEMRRLVDEELKKQSLLVRIAVKPILAAKWPKVEEVLPVKFETEIDEKTNLILAERSYTREGNRLANRRHEVREPRPDLTADLFDLKELKLLRPPSLTDYAKAVSAARKTEQQMSGEKLPAESDDDADRETKK